MGLDMYLTKRDGTQLGYWRKANQIRQWFVDHAGYPETGNCIDFQISDYTLEELYNTCREVLAHPEKAEELLPSSSGFFFGGTEYNEWYFEQVKETADMIDNIFLNDLVDWDKDGSVIYSEWW